uniref:ATP synthase complex subunit 8 n=1 Tax=Latuspina sp. TaxID=3138292 RepID=A0AB38ZLB9_9HYME
MPQMKPMNWFLLFLYFLFSFLLMNNNLYFFNYKNYKLNNNLNMKHYNKFNFMW